MPWAVAAAGVAAGGSILGSQNAASAAKEAGNQVANAENNTLNFQQGVYDTSVNNLSPFLNTGTQALSQLSGLYGLGGGTAAGTPGGNALAAFTNFTQLPSYQFPLQQGELAANRGLAASGLAGSGAQAKALTQYGQGYASQGFNGYISQLAGLAGMGQSAANQIGTLGNNAAQTIAGANTAAGSALASGTLGAAKATNQGIEQVAGDLGGLLTNTKVQSYLSGLTNNSSSSSIIQPQTANNPAMTNQIQALIQASGQ